MSDDDPFFGGGDGDRTILRPRPGGRRPAQPRQPAQQPGYAPPQQGYAPPPQPGYAPVQPGYGQPMGQQQPSYQAAPASLGQLGGGVNPLTSAATTLVALISQLRESPHHPDPQSLFQHVCNEIREFEAVARGSGVSPDHVLAARYVLSTAIDETVLNTPWGSQSVWATQTLLTAFHNDAWGGEKFFQLLDRMLQDPRANLYLLEFMYLLIALGFEGKYRIQERGRADLERIQNNLYQVIRSQRGDIERALSPRWQGVKDKRSRLEQYVPLWVVAAAAAGFLIVLFFGFSFAVSRASDPVMAEIASLGRGVVSLDRGQAAFVPAPSADLATLLQREIAAGRLEVVPDPRGQRVVLAGDGLFASGRADVDSASVPLLGAIADALAQVPGQVVVTGHTDNVQMSPFGRSPFKSNFDLSKARADAVTDILAERLPADRLESEGASDTQPIASNDTPEGRARNRRVEILLQRQAGRL